MLKMFALFWVLLAGAAEAVAQGRECPVTDVTPGSPVSSAIEATDCRLSDLVTGNTSSLLGKRFAFTAPDRGVYTFSIAATGFPPALAIFTSQGRVVGVGSAASGGTARLSINLPADKYTFIIYSNNTAAGTFELNLTGSDIRPCPVVDLPETGLTQAEFGPTSCRFLDLTDFNTNTTNVAQFRYAMPRRGVLSLDTSTNIARLTSTIVVGTLGTLSGAKSMKASLAQGSYLIRLTTTEVGSFTIDAKPEDLRACPETAIKIGEEVSGKLEATSCRWLDRLLNSTDQTPLAIYRLAVAESTVVQIDESSLTADTYLALFSANLSTEIAANDDVADDTNSRLLVNLPGGTYIIFASSYDQTELGDFQLKVAGEAPRKCEPQVITSGAQLEGQVPAEGACRALDYVALSTITDPVAPFRLTNAAAQVNSFRVEGATASSLRMLTAGGRETFRTNIGATGIFNVDLRTPAGAIELLVGNIAETKPVFRLTVESRDPQNCPATPLALDSELEGVLTSVECKYSEFVNFASASSPTQPYQVITKQRGTLLLEAESSVFAPLLILVSPEGEILTGVLSPTPGVASLNLVNLPANDYRILITTTTANGAGGFKARSKFTPSGAAASSAGQSRFDGIIHQEGGASPADAEPTWLLPAIPERRPQGKARRATSSTRQ